MHPFFVTALTVLPLILFAEAWRRYKRHPIRSKILLIAGFVLLFLPIPSRGTPTWDVQVVNLSGIPVPGITVKLTWADGEDLLDQKLTTNRNGHVIFAARKVWAAPFGRIWLKVEYLYHGGFVSYASVSVFDKGLSSYFPAYSSIRNIDTWQGYPPEMKTQLHVAPLSKP